jgi:hypothetical protein
VASPTSFSFEGVKAIRLFITRYRYPVRLHTHKTSELMVLNYTRLPPLKKASASTREHVLQPTMTGAVIRGSNPSERSLCHSEKRHRHDK